MLRAHGMQPGDDAHLYHIVLKISLDPDPDWWGKLQRKTAARHMFHEVLQHTVY